MDSGPGGGKSGLGFGAARSEHPVGMGGFPSRTPARGALLLRTLQRQILEQAVQLRLRRMSGPTCGWLHRLHRSHPFAKSAKGWGTLFIGDLKDGPPARA